MYKGKSVNYTITDNISYTEMKISGKIFPDYEDLFEFRKDTESIIKEKKHLIIDFSDLDYMNSMGIKEIVQLRNIKVNSGYKFVLSGIQSGVKKILDELHILTKIDSTQTIQDAKKLIGADAV